MTRIGTDVKVAGGATLWGGVLDTVIAVARAGLDGVRFRTIDQVSATLDTGVLAELRDCATDSGMYVEMGIGKVNPYMTAELPSVRDLGDGDYVRAMQRMIECCAEMGWTSLWTATGGFKPYPGRFFTDRFRTDADWSDQLAATEQLLVALAPVLRDTGCHLDIETHEEITSFEVVRLVESVGPDVLGVCFDPANVLVNGELPLEAARRVAPYVRSTQLRDAAMATCDGQPTRVLAPIGDGVTDWFSLLEIILSARPALDLTIEGIGGSRAEMALYPDDDEWLRGHPDLVPEELARLLRWAAAPVAGGDSRTGGPVRDGHPPTEVDDHDWFVARSATYLRQVISRVPTSV
jgi:sugar phosphate isomerase/epimerase